MGMFDKVKFWKKEDDFSDLSNLGDFGLEEKPGAPSDLGGLGGDIGAGLGGGLGEMPNMGMHDMPGAVPTHREEVQPTQASKDLSEQFGIKPAAPTQQPTQQQPFQQYPTSQPQPQQQFQAQQPYQQYQQAPNLGEMAKDIEIIHAKLDAIKSTLDAINQRLATIERMAGGEPRQKYTW